MDPAGSRVLYYDCISNYCEQSNDSKTVKEALRYTLQFKPTVKAIDWQSCFKNYRFKRVDVSLLYFFYMEEL